MTKQVFTIDTEFFDRGHNDIHLLSVGVVGADGSSYYAVVAEAPWNLVKKNEWLRDNVMPVIHDPRIKDKKVIPYRTRLEIKGELTAFFAKYNAPQFWAYFADWDWVLFSHLFGTLLEGLPQFPQMCLDIKQEMMRLRIPRMAISDQETPEHNALNDAEWNMQILREVALRERRLTGYSWIDI